MDALITDATSADERRRGPKVAVLPVGSFGQPSLGTAAKGKTILDSLSRSAAAHLAVLAGLR
ncbi:hypothetical protein [Kitasatospora sp. GP82]|uniref:hypothetical protein n=1 Tax=Kitasatospora sp. GP82 TaxID=3035089 RepID=UPI00247715B3|nr:hypothetical protein [Kitasatospora sp. GP82]MDH6130402.1 hypothetical protein [Kitasatospora sp. GP82]